MTNKPMLSVERELLELVTDNKHIDKESISIRRWEALCKLRAILSKPAAQHQGDPVAIVTGSTVQWLPGAGKIKDRTPLYAEQPAPVADQTQCEECKGWGYHENHHEGGGTECGKCGGSGNATVAAVIPDHTMRSVMDAIQQARGFPVLTSNQCHALAESLNYVARLNGVKP